MLYNQHSKDGIRRSAVLHQIRLHSGGSCGVRSRSPIRARRTIDAPHKRRRSQPGKETPKSHDPIGSHCDPAAAFGMTKFHIRSLDLLPRATACSMACSTKPDKPSTSAVRAISSGISTHYNYARDRCHPCVINDNMRALGGLRSNRRPRKSRDGQPISSSTPTASGPVIRCRDRTPESEPDHYASAWN